MSTARRRAHRVPVMAALAAVLVLAGCASSGAPVAAAGVSPAAGGSGPTLPSASPPPKRPVAARPTSHNPGTFTAVVNSVRGSSAGFLTVVWTVTNTSDDSIELSDDFALAGSEYSYFVQAIAGVTVVDPGTDLRYYPLQENGRSCVCSEYVTHAADDELAAGESWTMFATYRPDRIPAKVEVDIKGFAPAKGVAVTRS